MNEHTQFAGFTPACVGTPITMPAEWALISASIDNLSEYKVTEYILRHSWAAGNVWMEITTEQFMHGFVYDDGEIGDYGTGLSKPSVIMGLRRAIEHGYIECEVDDTNKTAIRKFYRVTQQEVIEETDSDVNEVDTDVKILYSENREVHSDVKNVDNGEMALEAESAGCKDALPLSNESNLSTDNYIDEEIRIIHSGMSKSFPSKYPQFIVSYLRDFSKDLGDEEHTAQNIAQASKLYKQSGVSQDAFVEMLYAARETAKQKAIKKTNSRGWTNRMPYFFKCLDTATRAAREQGVG